jgi:hypothetical protein
MTGYSVAERTMMEAGFVLEEPSFLPNRGVEVLCRYLKTGTASAWLSCVL